MTPTDSDAAPTNRSLGASEPPPAAPGPVWRMAEHWPELSAALSTQAAEAADRVLRGLELLRQRERLSAAEMRVLASTRISAALRRSRWRSSSSPRSTRSAASAAWVLNAALSSGQCSAMRHTGPGAAGGGSLAPRLRLVGAASESVGVMGTHFGGG